jgi:hypothetical protein
VTIDFRETKVRETGFTLPCQRTEGWNQMVLMVAMLFQNLFQFFKIEAGVPVLFVSVIISRFQKNPRNVRVEVHFNAKCSLKGLWKCSRLRHGLRRKGEKFSSDLWGELSFDGRSPTLP